MAKTIKPSNDDVTTSITILKHMNETRCRNNGYLVHVSPADLFTVQRAGSKSTSSSDDNAARHNGLLQVVSQQSQNHGCKVAINGGPFQKSGECVGGVVVDNGRVVSHDFRPDNVGFGRIFQRRSSNSTNGVRGAQHDDDDDDDMWILGGIRNSREAASLHVQHYVTGMEWLVYNSSIVVQQQQQHTSRHFVRKHLRAPRTAIGITATGHLLLLVVDGCEACLAPSKRGVTLEELAALFLTHGVHHAIGLDGGSSTTLVTTAAARQPHQGGSSRVENVPTCMDVPWKCERPVATIVCLKSSSGNANNKTGVEEGNSGDVNDGHEEKDAQ